MELRVVTPANATQVDAVRDLCWEYRSFLLRLGSEDEKIVRHVYPRDKYTEILERLETDHRPPNGALKLALLDGLPAGCGMSHRLLPDTVEFKRIYVRDVARGFGVGRAIVEALIEQARSDGYKRIYMDTGIVLTAAQSLYLSMGFRLRGPYQDVPEFAKDRLKFFEMDL